MTSHVSNAILSLIRFVFVDEECVYRISINIMNEMEKKDGHLVFLKEKLSLLIQRLGFNKVHTSCISGFFFNPYLKSLATPHNCVCVCRHMCNRQVHSRVLTLCNSWPSCPLRPRGAHLHSHPKYLLCGSHEQARS